jgi:hypothetical protein
LYIVFGIIPGALGVNLFFSQDSVFGGVNITGRRMVYSLIFKFIENYIGNWFLGIIFFLFGFWMTNQALLVIFEMDYFYEKNYKLTKKIKIINAFFFIIILFFITAFKNEIFEFIF